jgi:HD-GYP domain-containing protein (c-di-GMP phosphodiesterase class II)
VFDALTNERPYKHAMPYDLALREITANAGRHFDPDVAAALPRVLASDALSAGA